MEKEWIALVATLSGVALTGLIAFALKWLEMGRQKDEESRKNRRSKLEDLHALVLDYPAVIGRAATGVVRIEATLENADLHREEIVGLMMEPMSSLPRMASLQRLYAPDLDDAWDAVIKTAALLPNVLQREAFRSKRIVVPPGTTEIEQINSALQNNCLIFANQLEEKILRL